MHSPISRPHELSALLDVHLMLLQDEDLIVTAHEAAWGTVESDPDLAASPALRRELDLLDAERAAFLERG